MSITLLQRTRSYISNITTFIHEGDDANFHCSIYIDRYLERAAILEDSCTDMTGDNLTNIHTVLMGS